MSDLIVSPILMFVTVNKFQCTLPTIVSQRSDFTKVSVVNDD